MRLWITLSLLHLRNFLPSSSTTKKSLGRNLLNFGAYVKSVVLVKKLPPHNGGRGGAVG
jgi:hypothetical protein